MAKQSGYRAAGFMDGFMNGFGFVDRLNRADEARDFRNRRAKAEDEYRDKSLGVQKKAVEMRVNPSCLPLPQQHAEAPDAGVDLSQFLGEGQGDYPRYGLPGLDPPMDLQGWGEDQ